MSQALLLTQCLQNDFVKPIARHERLPNLLHIGYEEARRLMGDKPAEGPIARVMEWAYAQPDEALQLIHIRDWHDPLDIEQMNHLMQFGLHCEAGTPGAEFHPALNMNPVEAIFRKGTDPAVDSYSGFYDNAKAKSTGLMGYLKEKGVTEVAVVGLATDYCVKFTALDALEAGFKVTLIEDAARGVNLSPGDVDAAVRAMREAGVAVTRSEAVTA